MNCLRCGLPIIVEPGPEHDTVQRCIDILKAEYVSAFDAALRWRKSYLTVCANPALITDHDTAAAKELLKDDVQREGEGA